MSLFGALTEKPWLTPRLKGWTGGDERSGRTDAGVFLGGFLGVVAVLFTLITTAYLMRMGVHGPVGHGGGDWGRLPEPPLLWVNTGVLALSSLAWRSARTAAHADDRARLRIGLVAGGVLALVFLVGQIAVWRELQASGYFLSAQLGVCTTIDDPLAQPIGHFLSGNPAVAFFYFITGLHGLHMIGGLVAWGRTTARVMGGAAPAAVTRSVELTARYWHFLLLVWLLMFGLLLMT